MKLNFKQSLQLSDLVKVSIGWHFKKMCRYYLPSKALPVTILSHSNCSIL